jgi:hypothetical protein
MRQVCSSVALFSALLCYSASDALAAVKYVNVNLTTGADDGSSWANAYRTVDGINRAVTAAAINDEVWVAAGTYYPTATTNRNLALNLRTGVAIYGGFAGVETSRDQRNLATNITRLSGDLGRNDPVITDNSSHIVNGNSANASAILDGFTITAGNANATTTTGDLDRGGGLIFLSNSNATIRNCRIVNNRSFFGGGGTYIRQSSPTFIDVTWENNAGGAFGGAIDMFNTCNPTFTRCTFRSNTATRAGGVEVFGNCQPTFTNCLFANNTAGNQGAGGLLVASNSTATLRHCTFVGNSTTGSGSAILTNQSTTRLFNSIVYFNTTNGSTAAQLVGTTTTVTYSCIQNTTAGTGNITADPQFVDRLAGDYQLRDTSPCIDAANAADIGAANTLDLRNQPRRVDAPLTTDTGPGGTPVPDMGALEFQPPAPPACDSIDFNNNQVFPEDQDVIDFFNVLAGGDCPTCNDIDFNNNDVFPEDQDVIDFFNVLAGGTCP